MKTSIEIQNLKCGGCANTVTKGISKLDNVSNVEVDVENNVVTFEYTDEATLEKVTSTLLKMGYPKAGDNNSLGSKAKSYVSCAIGRMDK